MELRYALLLIGLIVVAVVVFQTLDLARLRPRRRDGVASADSPEPPSPPRLEPIAGIDFDPPLQAVAEKRSLTADVPVGAPVPQRVRDPLREEIETLEEVATMPLNLDAGLRRSRQPDSARQAVPDDKIDFILRLPADAAVMRDTALGVYKQYEFEIDKPHRLYGCRADSDIWSELQHDSQRARYGDLALSVQLVDSRGPIGDTELHKFSQVGLKLADALHRRTQFSMPFEDALARARELHQFCDTFDVIAAVHAVAKDGPFKGRLLEHTARKLGMQWGAHSIFHMKNEFSPGSRHLFSMASLTGAGEFPAGQWDTFKTEGVTFFISVPCVHRPASVFDKMIACAQTLAETLNGELQDQGRKPLTSDGIA
ncbi:MAG TPA: cell division protein ZipA C-terminal FtsZ-binding domain-containing protein, partial [Burkholderiales bacterium]|nr:cell division protein ZipA C-terminal FtsZ-binding domain-containing protein [Burkholderiales bacterium]